MYYNLSTMGKGKKSPRKEEILLKILKTESLLHKIQDLDVLLEQILTEARSVVNADAGSIYIAKQGRLAIRYAQNNTLQKQMPEGKKLPYIFFDFPINNSTIAGCAANTKEIVNVPNVYEIPEDKPYKFSTDTDKATGYKTVSNLAIPLISMSGLVLGVLQVLNPMDANGKLRAFTEDDELYMSHFASNASVALEHAFLTRAMILRMIKMAELRDPKETGMHVTRVSSYAVEIYDNWAFKNNIPLDERMDFRDSLKIAAMLHDVGKVGIPDAILKKPAKLTDEEFAIMETHTWLGARLFNEAESELERLCRTVALRHHEGWDGKGYPGYVEVETGKPLKVDEETGKAVGLKGTEIPFAARIVTIADVYDALSSKRAYKPAWEEDAILKEMRRMSGLKFDPELLECFFDVLPQIHAIKKTFVEEEDEEE